MIHKIKNYLIAILCIPVIFFCGCSKNKPSYDAVENLSYYFQENVECNLFKELPNKTVKLKTLTSSKLDKNSMLDAFAKITLKANGPEFYHMYIEYICFKVYTNETSDFELNVNIELTNAINEEDVNKIEPEDNKFETIYSCIAKKNNTAEFRVYVNRTIATTTGSTLSFNILDSEIYATDPDTNFKWCIFDLKIHGESKAY
ncbi:MAG: hypothetical protein IJX17_01285 [Clostridia bacterium]|nr:hypothetical protein [Clostridia bacterium]